MEARVGGRRVAGAAEDIRALADASCSEEDSCADGVASRFVRLRFMG